MQPRKLTILVVEDNTDTREFLEFLLMSEGYQVITAEDGHTGLEYARTYLVHAVLLDRRLPAMDGLDVCRQLRDRLGPALPILLVTADSEPGLAVKAVAAGITAVVKKPFLPEVLLDRLTALLGTSGAS